MTVTFIILENFNRWLLKQDSSKVEGCMGRWLSRDFGEAEEQVCNQELEAASTAWVLRAPGDFTLSSLLRKDSTCWGSGVGSHLAEAPALPVGSGCGTVTSDECSWCRQSSHSTPEWKASWLPVSDRIRESQLILAHNLFLIREFSDLHGCQYEHASCLSVF